MREKSSRFRREAGDDADKRAWAVSGCGDCQVGPGWQSARGREGAERGLGCARSVGLAQERRVTRVGLREGEEKQAGWAKKIERGRKEKYFPFFSFYLQSF
jgi:hypothetical protein